MPEEFISCLGVAIAYSLVEICKTLDKTEFTDVNKLQSSTTEHGLSAGIILLSVAMVESALNRAKYISGSNEKQVLNFFKNHIDNGEVYKNLEEIYVIRDSIIHNHIWKVNVPFPENLNDPNITFHLLPGYGDSKFRRVVNMRTKQTNRLAINIIPTRLNRKDVIKVLEVVWNVSVALQKKDVTYFPLENFSFKWDKKQFFTFPQLVDFLSKKWSN